MRTAKRIQGLRMIRPVDMHRAAILVACSALGLMVGGGCQPDGPGVTPVAPPLSPRTIDEIVSVIEANAALLDQPLWSNSVSVTARVRDEKGKEHTYNLDSSFLFDKPRSLRMDLRPSVGDQVMQIGSNDEDFWLWIEPEVGTLWWGRHRHVGEPCAGTVSVRPDQLVAALVLGGLPEGEDGLIGPAPRTGKTYDVLIYLRENSDGTFQVDREYWVQRVPPHLVQVVVFRDRMGRISMSAYLEDHRRAWEGGPVVPHEISIIWPLAQGKLTLSVGRFKGMDAAKVSRRAFARPTQGRLPSGIERVIQVDLDCDEPEGAEPQPSGAGGE